MVTSGPPRTFTDDLCGPGSLSLVLNALGDPATAADLEAAMPRAPGGGVLSVDLLLAARQRGFVASLGSGDGTSVRGELDRGRATILMLRLLDAPGSRRDIYHYVVVDGFDPGRALFRFQFGDGRVRWAPLRSVEKAWRAAGHALLRVRPDTAVQIRRAVDLEAAGPGRREEARDLYRRIVEEDPASVRAWTNLGNVLAAEGRRAEAEAAYRRALGLAPDDRDAANNLAWLLQEGGSRLEEAEALALKASARAGPDQVLALDTLGRIQLARGRCDDAERTLRRALSALDASSPRPLRAGLLVARGEAEKSCGRREEARASFRQALESEPDDKTSQAARSALESLGTGPSE
ncbi:MAG TPA: tetratricopeptide repeat protein [Vicinamibacteria bacterium]|nr:tetratricopeptide repeat protein [Vicinamibacteria bacterium]